MSGDPLPPPLRRRRLWMAPYQKSSFQFTNCRTLSPLENVTYFQADSWCDLGVHYSSIQWSFLSAYRGRGLVRRSRLASAGLGWPRLLEAAYTTTNALVVRMKVRVFTSNINDMKASGSGSLVVMPP